MKNLKAPSETSTRCKTMTESALEHAEVLKNELKLIGAVDTDGVSVLSDDKLVKGRNTKQRKTSQSRRNMKEP